jgi:hypothetical protein
MVPRSHYMPRQSGSHPPAWPIIMDALENAHARLGDAVHMASPPLMRREVVRVMAGLREVLQADGRLPPAGHEPGARNQNRRKSAPNCYRANTSRPVHLRSLTEEQLDYYRLLRRKSFTMAEALATVRPVAADKAEAGLRPAGGRRNNAAYLS